MKKPVSKREFRCGKCHKLLAIEDNTTLNLAIKCLRCGRIEVTDPNLDRQLIITDKNGTILSINKKTEEVTGYSLSEVIGKKPSIWGRQMSFSFYKKMWKNLLKKKIFTVNITNKSKKGKLYKVLLKITPFLNKNKNIEFFLGEEKPLQ